MDWGIENGYVFVPFNQYKGPVSETLSKQIVDLLAKKDLKVAQEKLKRLNRAILDKQAIKSINLEKSPENSQTIAETKKN